MCASDARHLSSGGHRGSDFRLISLARQSRLRPLAARSSSSSRTTQEPELARASVKSNTPSRREPSSFTVSRTAISTPTSRSMAPCSTCSSTREQPTSRSRRDDAHMPGLATSIGMQEVIGRGAERRPRRDHAPWTACRWGRRRPRAFSAVVLNSGEQSLLGQSFLRNSTMSRSRATGWCSE